MKTAVNAQTSANHWELSATNCRLRAQILKPCVLLVTIDGFTPDHFEEPLLAHIRSSCSDAYQLDLFLNLENAQRFPVKTMAWISFINEHIDVFNRIYILTTTKENTLTVNNAADLIRRDNLIVVIKKRLLFDAWVAHVTGD